MILGSIGFTTPWILAALILLPVLWILLRAIPPAPVRRLFPGVALLLGLTDDDSVSDRTPWWLLLLRSLAVAAAIIGLAGPVLNPSNGGETGKGPLLIVMDASWASAPDWEARIAHLDRVLIEVARASRPVALVQLTAPEPPNFQTAQSWRSRLAGLAPRAWEPVPGLLESYAADTNEKFDTIWFSDGLDRASRAPLATALAARGDLSVVESKGPVVAMAPVGFSEGAMTINALRVHSDGPRTETAQVIGRDPVGTLRQLAEIPLVFAADDTRASASLSLPAELRGRVTQIRIAGIDSAGAVVLADDSLRRREVGLVTGRENREGLELLSPLHYLRQALLPTSDLVEGALDDILPANPDVIVLADIATIAPENQQALQDWTEAGGLLLRFAGPHLAASEVSRSTEDPLLPVRLRAGGRTVGGAMSWGAPKTLAPFDVQSPFHGLSVPEDVAIRAQVMAQPDPDLASRSIALLTDGTPLITRKPVGQGQVVLFHVTANAEWSSLPLSGLFVSMLERLAISNTSPTADLAELAGTTWQPVSVLDGFGVARSGADLPGVPGDALLTAPFGPDLQPGVYDSDGRRLARNLIGADRALALATWPPGTRISNMQPSPETPLGGGLIGLALMFLCADVIAALAVTGRLGRRATKVGATLLALAVLPISDAYADDRRAVDATAELVLAHVLTGNTAVDRTAQEGLLGLSETLYFRTSVEPATPLGVDLERDELAFFPLLYWPITPNQPRPSDAAYARLNQYLRSGGMILFDTRDADVAGFGAASPNGRKLQQLAAPLEIPRLEQVPQDHVLTRTFYLLQEFPGRYQGRELWVEAAPPSAERAEGMPFRNLNDGVTPVVIGGNDWAAAWAMDNAGNPRFPVGRGLAGERQRELAYRFGVNLVMHVLTGNYKSDQVHVPALLERLGQ
ncbi:MAG: LytTR family transcriptional regulator [Rhodobacterales bacterium]|nr:MAG: LytTR family transcriptional regulator [Rhodobacterales bacterium]